MRDTEPPWRLIVSVSSRWLVSSPPTLSANTRPASTGAHVAGGTLPALCTAAVVFVAESEVVLLGCSEARSTASSSEESWPACCLRAMNAATASSLFDAIFPPDHAIRFDWSGGGGLASSAANRCALDTARAFCSAKKLLDDAIADGAIKALLVGGADNWAALTIGLAAAPGFGSGRDGRYGR